jgi:hypothetical protein
MQGKTGIWSSNVHIPSAPTPALPRYAGERNGRCIEAMLRRESSTQFVEKLTRGQYGDCKTRLLRVVAQIACNQRS